MIPKNTTTAAALVGGYFLGRTKKAKMAIGVGMFLAGRRLDLDPRRLGKLLAASPVTGALSEQIRRELFEATKSAAAQALTQRAAGLADSLQQRTRALGRDETSETDEDDGPGTRKGDAEAAEDAAETDDAADGDRGKGTRSTAAARSAGKKTSSRASSSGGTSGRGTGKSTTARKRTSAPGKPTASRARKGRGDGDE
ncbi:hypothetical protein EF910_07740 [Streptomyces sp. WAC07149]|uniref:hypothetical protein n=1 Tax=Streptomyces sp. WAC07149 TaxID=2487425 RepID=UPI000F76D413|nr:hypothetical protein [Streptomyces sp. WAC07149]RST06870.1 hypothetical protein EF910_07740 [Streptomyces sp. WAC07149]